MISVRRLATSLLLFTLVVSACSSDDSAPDSAEGITLQISGDSGVAEDPVERTVTLTNESDSDVTLVRPTHLPNVGDSADE